MTCDQMSQTKMGGLLLRVALLAALSLVLPCLVEGGRAGEPWTVGENREKLQPAAILASQAVKERGGRDESNGGAPLSDGGSLEDSPGKRFADWYKNNKKIVSLVPITNESLEYPPPPPPPLKHTHTHTHSLFQ